ncbi:MAG: hypothetical protein JNN27_21005 [Planctomycetes bacterium]|nr:hypothetical protein [Planctomycetota bacterium]
MDASQHAPIPSDARTASSSEALAPESSPDDANSITAKQERRRKIGRFAGGCFAALTTVTLAAGLYINAFHLHLGFPALAALLGLCALPLMFISGVTWAALGLRASDRGAGYALVLSACAAYVAMAQQHVGMRLAALVSRPALADLAERVRSGKPVRWPTRAGLFVVVGIRTQGPIVALVIKDEWSGDSALVHFPEGSPSDAEITRLGKRAFYGPMYNLNWNIGLGGGWRYQDED